MPEHDKFDALAHRIASFMGWRIVGVTTSNHEGRRIEFEAFDDNGNVYVTFTEKHAELLRRLGATLE